MDRKKPSGRLEKFVAYKKLQNIKISCWVTIALTFYYHVIVSPNQPSKFGIMPNDPIEFLEKR